jgi:glycosyltransferase involved in cell wall biosynthesis
MSRRVLATGPVQGPIEPGLPETTDVSARHVRSNDDIPPCLTVVIPVFNEAATVEEIVGAVLLQRPVQQVIVIDDASDDGTWPILERIADRDARVRLVRHLENSGKGAALRTGFGAANAPIVVIQDADLEYDPLEYYLLLNPILAGKADVVYGSRFLGSGAHRVLYYWHAVGNRLLTTLSNMTTNLNLTDMESCYKAFRGEVLRRVVIEEDRFGFEPEITAKVARLGVRLYEVPISYNGRTYEQGKKIGWRDGARALWSILKYGLRRSA